MSEACAAVTTAAGDAGKARFGAKTYIAEGTFSRVYSVTDTEAGDAVALKRVHRGDPRQGLAVPAYAEVRALMELRHPNIVQLRHVFPRNGRLNLVLERCVTDLETVLAAKEVPTPLCEMDVKLIMKMLFQAVDHCHRSGFLHQDIKPGNLLLAADGTVKLADFGLAVKVDEPAPRLFHQVVTLGFRPPELLLSARRHGVGVDLWSCGVVLGELLRGKALFDDRGELALLFSIIGVLGAPTRELWPGMADLPTQMEFGDAPAVPWTDVLPGGVSEAAVHLLSQLLVYDPTKRLSAAQALAHPFLADVPPDAVLSFMPAVAAGVSPKPPAWMPADRSL